MNEDDGTGVPASATGGDARRSDTLSGHDARSQDAPHGGGAATQAPNVALAGADRQADAATQADAHTRDDRRPDAPRKRRRRRRKRKGGQRSAVTPVEAQTDAPAEEPAKPKRRRSRRPGRRADADRAASTTPPETRLSTPDMREKPARRRRGPTQERSNLYAALDLGTNNCRLLVATPRPRGDFRVVDAFSRIVRLGEGLGASGRLSDDAMDRAVEALRVCASKLGSRPVRRLRLIATEACRRAENGERFIARVADETGLELEIVDRETEARLAVSGCGVLVDRRAKGAVLFDIGGGSSELSLLDMRRVNKRNGRGRKRGRRPADAIAAWTSLPLGVVTLSEKHGGGRAVTRHVFENMVEEVTDLLERFEGREALAEMTDEGDVHLLGTSGTVTTLAGVHLQLPRYDRRYVDGVWMRSADVDRTIDDLIDMGFDRRVQNPCIGRDRADLVLAGCAILVAIQRMWPCERLRVADRGLREGILSELMHEDGAWRAATPKKSVA